MAMIAPSAAETVVVPRFPRAAKVSSVLQTVHAAVKRAPGYGSTDTSIGFATALQTRISTLVQRAPAAMSPTDDAALRTTDTKETPFMMNRLPGNAQTQTTVGHAAAAATISSVRSMERKSGALRDATGALTVRAVRFATTPTIQSSIFAARRPTTSNSIRPRGEAPRGSDYAYDRDNRGGTVPLPKSQRQGPYSAPYDPYENFCAGCEGICAEDSQGLLCTGQCYSHADCAQPYRCVRTNEPGLNVCAM